jgi:geranylgeranyl diphosphate synthase type II
MRTSSEREIRNHSSCREAIAEQINQEIVKLCKNAGSKTVEQVKYHQRSGGSKRRALLCYDTARSFNHSHQTALLLACSVELLHNASLIHDDIQDQDMTRRDQAALWVKSSVAEAICVGDSLIAAAYMALGQLAIFNEKLIPLVSLRVMQTIKGQMSDIGQGQFSRSSYTDVAKEKAAPLLRLSVELPSLLANSSIIGEKLAKAAELFAIAYQFNDDISDQIHDAQHNEPNIVNIVAKEQEISPNQCAVKNAESLIITEIQAMLTDATNILNSLPKIHSEPLFNYIERFQNRVLGQIK